MFVHFHINFYQIKFILWEDSNIGQVIISFTVAKHFNSIIVSPMKCVFPSLFLLSHANWLINIAEITKYQISKKTLMYFDNSIDSKSYLFL